MLKNKICMFTLMLLIVVFSSTSFATDCKDTFSECDAIADGTNGGSGITGMQFSPNVVFAYVGAQNQYVAGTFNTSGTKAYGVTDDYAGIYVTKADVTQAQANTDFPSTASGSWSSGTWAEVAK